MKYTLTTALLLITFAAQSQTIPAQQVQLGDVQAEIQPTVLSDDHATLDIRDLSGDEAVKVDIQKDSENQVHMIIRDKKTGQVLSDAIMTQNERIDSVTEANGIRSEMHLRQSGLDDVVGTAAYDNAQTGESIKMDVRGDQLGSLTQTKGEYTLSLGINGNNTTATITEKKTKKVICSMVDDGQTSRIYGPDKQLIAEGNSDDDAPTRIYNDAAYKNCEKVMSIFDSEEND